MPCYWTRSVAQRKELLSKSKKFPLSDIKERGGKDNIEKLETKPQQLVLLWYCSSFPHTLWRILDWKDYMLYQCTDVSSIKVSVYMCPLYGGAMLTFVTIEKSKLIRQQREYIYFQCFLAWLFQLVFIYYFNLFNTTKLTICQHEVEQLCVSEEKSIQKRNPLRRQKEQKVE